ncbi:hypothetical protein N658DRAFT_436799 [Parathielavia hyrcaniae]|uniref:Uncharacterized protein n=1 Tax=Parathielavia hyrcaniae TaxID=113614 RepID=A0AAN6SX00_9PEZI|nr:hypothetical protein N658DRAFT_436799 [Parathielavia hyrcaniae]
MLGEWHSAAARLFSHVAPGRLALSVVCDIDPGNPRAIEVATSVVEPIRLLPRGHLKECHIRLAKTADHQLQQLAQDTVSHACGIPTPSFTPPSKATTTLATLPRELRIIVLKYTDLVTPSREVTWSRHDRAYLVKVYEIDQFFRCWVEGHGCFCRRQHSAFSLGCTCWAPPGPALFLICRALYEDAQFVFFSCNRFIVHDYKVMPPYALPILEQHDEEQGADYDYEQSLPSYPYPYERFAVSEFLHDVVPAPSVSHLRFLELVFPPYRPGSWPDAQHPAMLDWRATVDWLGDMINLSGFTLRLMVAGQSPSVGPPVYWCRITDEEAETVMASYMDLLQPFTQLASDGLARFYAQFPYPWQLTRECSMYAEDHNWLQEKEDALQERAERHVMGRRYKGFYANRWEEPKPSNWCLSYYT